jgi:hypothetical protein
MCVFVISDRVCHVQWLVDQHCRQCLAVSADCMLCMASGVGCRLVQINSSCSFLQCRVVVCKVQWNRCLYSLNTTPQRLNLCHRWKWLVNFTPRSLDSRRKSPHPPRGTNLDVPHGRPWTLSRRQKFLPLPRIEFQFRDCQPVMQLPRLLQYTVLVSYHQRFAMPLR